MVGKDKIWICQATEIKVKKGIRKQKTDNKIIQEEQRNQFVKIMKKKQKK